MQSDMFYAGLTQTNESGDNGDFWFFLNGLADAAVITDSQYNAYVNNFNAWVLLMDAGTLIDTTPTGTHNTVASHPGRPKPGTR